MTTYDSELRHKLSSFLDSGHLRGVGEPSMIFTALSKVYPIFGSKIAWSKVPGAIQVYGVQSQVTNDNELEAKRFTAFFDEMIQRFSLSGHIVFVGDSATDLSLEGSIDIIKKVLPHLLLIPQHHYFIGAGYLWCMCLTMEGDMAFGTRSEKGHGTRSATDPQRLSAMQATQ